MNIQVNEISETKSLLKFKFWCKPPSAHILHLQPRKTVLISRAPLKKETESEGHLETAKEKIESKIHRHANQGVRNMQIKQCQEDHTLCIQREAQANQGYMFNRNNKHL